MSAYTVCYSVTVHTSAEALVAIMHHVLPFCRLNDVLEFAEDYECDVPKFWDYIAELLSPSVAHKSFPLANLKQAHEGPLESGKIGKLVAKTLHRCTSLQVGIGGRTTGVCMCVDSVSTFFSL